MSSELQVPLFPLRTVLFPGGPLSLRIFERRYLDMVSERMRRSEPFGVVFTEGGEAGPPGPFARVGTLARIVDFHRLDDGLLGLTCSGESRFRVQAHTVRTDALVVAVVDALGPEPDFVIAPAQERLRRLLRDILDRDEVRAYRTLLDERWDSGAWVGYRLAELLPLPAEARQGLLEIDAPEQRLAVLEALLEARGGSDG